MQFVYGRANANSNLSHRLNEETYQTRLRSPKKTFGMIHRRLRECDTFRRQTTQLQSYKTSSECLKWKRMCNASLLNNLEPAYEKFPLIVTCLACVRMENPPQTTALSLPCAASTNLTTLKLLITVTVLWIISLCNNPQFHFSVLFTNEGKLSRDLIMNIYNKH